MTLDLLGYSVNTAGSIPPSRSHGVLPLPENLPTERFSDEIMYSQSMIYLRAASTGMISLL
jgi:hypothetical protein